MNEETEVLKDLKAHMDAVAVVMRSVANEMGDFAVVTGPNSGRLYSHSVELRRAAVMLGEWAEKI